MARDGMELDVGAIVPEKPEASPEPAPQAEAETFPKVSVAPPKGTYRPNRHGEFVSMCEYQGILYLATKERLYRLRMTSKGEMQMALVELRIV